MPPVRQHGKAPVILNVYDLTPYNDHAYPLGLGAYHTGVGVYGREYAFGWSESDETGVFQNEPRDAVGATFREAVVMGETDKSREDVQRLVSDISPNFPGNSYHIVTRNCNSFSNELCKRLVGHEIPGWVNRVANVGSLFACLLPSGLLSQTPSSAQNSPFVPFSDEGHTLTDSAPNPTVIGTTDTSDARYTEDRRALLAQAALRRLQHTQQQDTPP